MRDYAGIHWRADEARLKTYAAATRAKGGAVVKIEIEVLDPSRLGYILQELAEIQRDQDAAAKAAVKPARAEAKKLAPAPRLLTYRGGE
ncbi:hypothetical protein Xaut_4514 [Xanthobacter versatilis]|uniref:Uncharacterized protein n=1 Tax=Xanthobacter autotrophicus (strain ATCC BAA-1158 / Py2) TaxID=78245 RepID=A7INY9_XANP2|nr:hypothetical protein Xaut_4514 [Xanthobacter autotrophicus Py2]